MKEEYSDRFDAIRKKMVETSYYKYGPSRANFASGNVNAIETLKLCIKKYEDTGNTEYLCDAANYAMFEYMYSQHPKRHYRSTDSGESAGIVGLSVGEMERLRNE